MWPIAKELPTPVLNTLSMRALAKTNNQTNKNNNRKTHNLWLDLADPESFFFFHSRHLAQNCPLTPCQREKSTYWLQNAFEGLKLCNRPLLLLSSRSSNEDDKDTKKNLSAEQRRHRLQHHGQQERNWGRVEVCGRTPGWNHCWTYWRRRKKNPAASVFLVQNVFQVHNTKTEPKSVVRIKMIHLTLAGWNFIEPLSNHQETFHQIAYVVTQKKTKWKNVDVIKFPSCIEIILMTTSWSLLQQQ